MAKSKLEVFEGLVHKMGDEVNCVREVENVIVELRSRFPEHAVVLKLAVDEVSRAKIALVTAKSIVGKMVPAPEVEVVRKPVEGEF